MNTAKLKSALKYTDNDQ